MSNTTVCAISSNLMRKAIPLCPSTPKTPLILSLSSAAMPHKYGITTRLLGNARNKLRLSVANVAASATPEFPGKTPAEFPSKDLDYQPSPFPSEIPRIPDTEIDPIPPEINTIPGPDYPVPPSPSPHTPPDNPLPPPGTPRPPPPDKLPPDPPPDIIPPPSTPPNIDPPPTMPPDILPPGGPFGPAVL
ncbi:hypothetical protein Pint_24718 [Pistacia integerrima]|uniref:Uncharacterized protein n=1 Tax=Pistacia integerrima TaxID=434235 RepID=A0ACC0YGF8_9ROSI|nr:hypothetical protein Pint_24718 [Pistacia integerrima]